MAGHYDHNNHNHHHYNQYHNDQYHYVNDNYNQYDNDHNHDNHNQHDYNYHHDYIVAVEWRYERMKRKFYRGTLPTIVWNPAAGKPLAVFKENQFVTQDDKVAETLLKKGYHEVGLEDQRPPVIPDEPIKNIENVKILSGGMSEKVELANIEAEREASDTTGTDAVEPKKDGGSKRSITRRTK